MKSFDTQIIKVDPLNPSVDRINRAAALIKAGEVVAFPTETVYGLGADATSDDAVKKIYAAKERPADNPLISHFASLDEIRDYVVEIPDIAEQLAEQFWPGPLTLVLRKNEKISDLVTQGLDTIAVRIPAHSVAITLIKQAGVPIAAPSANLSGKPSPTTADHVMTDLSGRIPAIIDGGSTSVGVESTVINLTDTQPVLLRPGGTTIEELREIIPELKVPDAAHIDQPLSPGMKYTHYSPETQLVLIPHITDQSSADIDTIVNQTGGNQLLLCLHSSHNHKVNHILLGNTLKEIQLNLFASLRLLDDENYDIGYIEEIQEIKQGHTIMNRIRKAVDLVNE